MSERRLSFVGAFMSAVGPMSLYLYAPAVAEAAAGLATTSAAINLTLSSFFGGFAISLLVVGPISDAVGRRATVYLFIGAFCLASIAAWLCESVESLLVARFIQGFGAAAGMSVSRALVRDVYAGKAAARVFVTMTMVLSVAPAVAPIVGGLTTTFFGWRSVFILMFVYGIILIAVCAFFVGETIQRHWARLMPREWWASYRGVLTRRDFTAPALCVGSLVGVVYANGTLLPSILMETIGFSPLQFSVAILAHPAGYMAGSIVAKSVLARRSVKETVLYGYCAIAIGCVGMLALLVWEPGAWRILTPVGLYSFGLAFIMPTMTAVSLDRLPHMAGAAASLLGFSQMAFGFIASVAGNAASDAITAIALLMPAMALLSLVGFAGSTTAGG